MNWTLSGATSPGQSGPGSNSNEGVLRIPQSSSITGTSPSDCLGSYRGHLLWDLTSLQRSSRYILQHQPTGQIDLCIAIQRMPVPISPNFYLRLLINYTTLESRMNIVFFTQASWYPYKKKIRCLLIGQHLGSEGF